MSWMPATVRTSTYAASGSLSKASARSGVGVLVAIASPAHPVLPFTCPTAWELTRCGDPVCSEAMFQAAARDNIASLWISLVRARDISTECRAIASFFATKFDDFCVALLVVLIQDVTSVGVHFGAGAFVAPTGGRAHRA
ncbi:hypothetical protein D9M72_595940 [compost metagenome]